MYIGNKTIDFLFCEKLLLELNNALFQKIYIKYLKKISIRK
jgi:hypothetical protein